jgi:hypothetical protein
MWRGAARCGREEEANYGLDIFVFLWGLDIFKMLFSLKNVTKFEKVQHNVVV